MAEAQTTSDAKAKQAKPEASKPQTYEFTVEGRPDGKLRAIGDRVDMLPAQAKYLLRMGHVRLVQPPVKAASKASRNKPKNKPKEPSGAPSSDAGATGDDTNQGTGDGDPARDEETPAT
ncbi:MAG: hypothetical protein AAGH43_06150 [Pseudomonadota bacterium]